MIFSSLYIASAQTYQEVTTITGSGDQTTNYFNIPTKEARYEWSYTSSKSSQVFSVFIYEENSGDLYVNALLPSSGQTSGTEYLHNLKPGNYYAKVYAANLDSYTVKVESQQSSGNAATPKPTNNNNDAGSSSSDDGDSAAGLVAVAFIAVAFVVLLFVFMRRRNKKR